MKVDLSSLHIKVAEAALNKLAAIKAESMEHIFNYLRRMGAAPENLSSNLMHHYKALSRMMRGASKEEMELLLKRLNTPGAVEQFLGQNMSPFISELRPMKGLQKAIDKLDFQPMPRPSGDLSTLYRGHVHPDAKLPGRDGVVYAAPDPSIAFSYTGKKYFPDGEAVPHQFSAAPSTLPGAGLISEYNVDPQKTKYYSDAGIERGEKPLAEIFRNSAYEADVAGKTPSSTKVVRPYMNKRELEVADLGPEWEHILKNLSEEVPNVGNKSRAILPKGKVTRPKHILEQ